MELKIFYARPETYDGPIRNNLSSGNKYLADTQVPLKEMLDGMLCQELQLSSGDTWGVASSQVGPAELMRRVELTATFGCASARAAGRYEGLDYEDADADAPDRCPKAVLEWTLPKECRGTSTNETSVLNAFRIYEVKIEARCVESALCLYYEIRRGAAHPTERWD